MISNLEKYKQDLKNLIKLGNGLTLAMDYECYPEKIEKQIKRLYKKKSKDYIKAIPTFRNKYQLWYSESLVVIGLLLPSRLNDFKRLYEKPKGRKEIDYGNYVIEDYLQGMTVTRGYEKEKVVGPDAAIPQFKQQLHILESVKKRFESSLFDIKYLVQADLFDSELDASKELNKKGFTRGAGAIAGVVLEGHLAQVCENHKIKVTKKKPGISDFNDLLKKNDVIDTATWRFIQHLGDLRNNCDHKKSKDPLKEEIEELIKGVEKIIKTLI